MPRSADLLRPGEPLLGRVHFPRAAGEALGLQKLRYQESHFDRLLRIEPGIAIGVIAVLELAFGDRARTAGAFRDVLAGHFEVNAAGVSALALVDREEGADLAHDPLEGPRLIGASF